MLFTFKFNEKINVQILAKRFFDIHGKKHRVSEAKTRLLNGRQFKN